MMKRMRKQNDAKKQENATSSAVPQKSIQFESFEPRVLMAADPATVAINSAISAPGEVDQYNFTLTSDVKVVFDSLTNNPDMNWSLSGPQGAVITGRSFSSSDSANLAGTPSIDLTAGDYTITVNANPGATGNYGFRLLELQNATAITPGTAVTDQLNPSNETNLYKFDATAGDHFFLDVTGRSGGDVTWQLLDPSGQQVFGPKAMNSASQDVDLPALTATGTYTLLVEGQVGAVEPANYCFKALINPTLPAAPIPTISWIGATGGDWNTASNWSAGRVPAATDDVYIGLPAGQTVTIAGGYTAVTVKSLTCNSDLTLSGNASLTLNSNSKVNGKLTLAGATLVNAG
jgi:hypothetical protein